MKTQGYEVSGGRFFLKRKGRLSKRNAHSLAKAERIVLREDFVREHITLVAEHMIDGRDLDIKQITPRLIEVKEGTKWEILFRWWNLVWWSLPYERAYGRQMRFIVWDEHHHAVIGLIGLQSPILSWAVRDEYLGLSYNKRDFWINQSLNAQRLGALPPYNTILGGKLVAMLVGSRSIPRRFKSKYEDQKTLMKKRSLPGQLLFITTTGAYGKSSVYTRLKLHTEYIARFIGYTHGSGSFHVPNAIYIELLDFLKKKRIDVKRGYGSGPSTKMRLIKTALRFLNYPNGVDHGIKRAVYIFSFVSNLKEVIQTGAKPAWIKRSISELTAFWKTRWAERRAANDSSYRLFSKNAFIKQTLRNLNKYKKTCLPN